MKTNMKFNIYRFIISIIISLIVLISFNYIDLLKGFELQIFDTLIKLRGKKQPNNQIVLLTVDDATAEYYGYPLPRRICGKLVRQLDSLDAEVIALDFLFSERIDDENDSVLVFTLDTTRNVINGFTFEFNSDEQDYIPDNANCHNHIYQHFTIKIDVNNKIKFYRASDKEFPHEDFHEFIHKGGHFSLYQDEDGHFRKIPLIVYYDGCYYPAFGLKIICEYFKLNEKDISWENNIFGNRLVLNLQQETIKIPVNKKGQMLLNFYGDINSFNQFSVLEFFHGDINKDFFKDKVVLIGSTLSNGADIHIIPFTPAFPGIGIHATMISNILNEDFIHESSLLLNCILVFSLSILFIYIARPNLLSFILSNVFGISMLVIAQSAMTLFEISNIWVKLLQISTAIFLSLIAGYIIEMKNRYNTEIKYLGNLKEILEKHDDNLESKSKQFSAAIQRAPKSLKEDLFNNYNNIIKKQDDLSKQMDDLKEWIKKMIEEKQDGEYGEIENLEGIEISCKRRKVYFIENNKNKIVIPFPPKLMALIYYLAKAKNNGEIWIEGGEIKKREMAVESSAKCSYTGIVGCEWDKENVKNISRPLTMPKVKKHQNLYIESPEEVAGIASEINKRTTEKINMNIITTPESENGMGHGSGVYVLTGKIEKIKFLK